MPISEHKCKRCGFKFTALRSASGRIQTAKCPNCCSSETERLPSRFAPRPPSCCTTRDPDGTCKDPAR
ncbi:MAG: zinc ribbon domain-containing protein [Armatimonadota bacterium]|nr:zinc ribbon domain-containing protein [Armatimonadota bacterium]